MTCSDAISRRCQTSEELSTRVCLQESHDGPSLRHTNTVYVMTSRDSHVTFLKVFGIVLLLSLLKFTIGVLINKGLNCITQLLINQIATHHMHSHKYSPNYISGHTKYMLGKKGRIPYTTHQ